jgi:hypothetical protein
VLTSRARRWRGERDTPRGKLRGLVLRPPGWRLERAGNRPQLGLAECDVAEHPAPQGPSRQIDRGSEFVEQYAPRDAKPFDAERQLVEGHEKREKAAPEARNDWEGGITVPALPGHVRRRVARPASDQQRLIVKILG